jgi:hypothetical protein
LTEVSALTNLLFAIKVPRHSCARVILRVVAESKNKRLKDFAKADHYSQRLVIASRLLDSATTRRMTQDGGYLFLKHSDWVMPSTVFGVIPAKRKAQRNADFVVFAIG